MNIKRLVDLQKIIVSNIEFKPPVIHIYASLSWKRANCPECKKYSNSMHERYERKIKDLPVFQYHSLIILTIRKFKCRNDSCKRKVFIEQNDNILPYARRTERITRLLSDIAIDMPTGSGYVLSLSEKLQIKISRSTLAGFAHQQALPTINTLRVVGVDDWAFRKGVNYERFYVFTI